MSKMNFGLTYLQGRKLTYEYAGALDECPEKWLDNKSAGIEWMKNFMKRHPVLSFPEVVKTDQPQQVLLQFGASIPHNINDNATEAEDVEINEPTIAVAQGATDNTQIVAPAPSVIDSDATDAEDIEVD
ncbi:hypothetical protein HHI36_007743 [Cryptolaemus montrouzieri]|uniref:Uncharacterized protein n=1 Tax=Cryptolaemus montrouzieri TaxID=559131 RepID=A0ABD2MQW2_9CUCU